MSNRTCSFFHDFLFSTDDIKVQNQLPLYNSHSSKYYGDQRKPFEHYSGFTYQQWRLKELYWKLCIWSSEPYIFLNRVRLQFQRSNPLQIFSVTSLVRLLARKLLSNTAAQSSLQFSRFMRSYFIWIWHAPFVYLLFGLMMQPDILQSLDSACNIARGFVTHRRLWF